MTPRVTIVGLGPGDAALLTIEARDLLAAADEVWLRTSRHPTVAGLPQGPRYDSFDALYESEDSFATVYAAIVERLLDLARRPQGVVYAVPGHPLFGEATVAGIIEQAAAEGLDLRIVAGVSFVDAVSEGLRLDPLAQGLLVLDALAFTAGRRLLAPQRPTLIAQIYDRRTASRVKLALLEAYPPDHAVRIVGAAGTSGAKLTETMLDALDRDDAFDHLAALYVPPLALTDDVRSFEGLRAIVARLRAPQGGCPWDLEQTHDSLKRFLIEEAYEALEALDDGDPLRLAEELGDLMMQVVLQAQVAEDLGEFAIEDVFGAITAKLVRRHPHVFGDVTVAGTHEVVRNWEELKKEERSGAPLLDAVPKSLPALAQAQSLVSRAQRAGLGAIDTSIGGWTLPSPLDLKAGLDAANLGDLLLAIATLAGERHIDAEDALRGALQRYRGRVAGEEAAVGER